MYLGIFPVLFLLLIPGYISQGPEGRRCNALYFLKCAKICFLVRSGVCLANAPGAGEGCVLSILEELGYGHQLRPAGCWRRRVSCLRDSCGRTMCLKGVRRLRL